MQERVVTVQEMIFQRRLKEADLKGRRPVTKPQIAFQIIKASLQRANQFKNCTIGTLFRHKSLDDIACSACQEIYNNLFVRVILEFCHGTVHVRVYIN